MHVTRASLGRYLPASLAVLLVFAPVCLDWVAFCLEASRASYALIVPPLAAIVAFLARAEGRADPPPSPSWLLQLLAGLIIATGSVLLAIGKIGSISTLATLSFPLVVTGLVLQNRGAATVWRYRWAILLLFLIVPIPGTVFRLIGVYTAEWSANMAAHALALLDDSTSWQYPFLHYREHRVQIVESCNGLSTLAVQTVLCAFMAGILRLRLVGGVALILIGVPLSLAVNSLRLVFTVLVLAGFGRSAAVGTPHELLGLILQILSVTLLALVIARWSKR